MDPTQGLTQRLSFEEVSQHLNATRPLDVQDVIKALNHPSVENYQAALRLLEDGYKQHFEGVQATAREQSSAVGEADLRRLKRQFSSLKNTFLHYEVKDEFIAAVADGLPNGTEDIQLAQFDEEVARNVAALRLLKKQNEETEREINGVIAQLVGVLSEAGRKREGAAAALARLQEELAAAERDTAEMPAPPGDGPDEGECHAALAAAAAETRRLEAEIAAQAAEGADLEAALTSDREDTEAARAELAELAARVEAEGQARSAHGRWERTEVWAGEAGALLGALGGVALLRATPNELALRLATSYPTAAVAAGSVGACARGSHELVLRLAPGSGENGGGGAVHAAELSPPDLDLQHVVEAARAGGRGADFVVREVRAQLAGLLHRRALMTEALARYPQASADPTSTTVTARVGPAGGEALAEARLLQCWPCGDDVVAVRATAPARRDGGGAGVGADGQQELLVEGRGFSAALDAIGRKVAV